MKRFSNGVLWAALLFFAAAYCSIFVAKGQPKAHEYLILNGAKAVMVQIWADSLHQDRPYGPAIFSRNGQVVAVLPYNSAWLTIQEFPK